ncbi:hypothetical protein KFK09_017720 [Dendrobium nobile]|uniref:Uncharacterized protein n=1 Tax=Dendrobium nobile TaxID=94219 RepID=A0A8T3ASA4_DENNO|nr:hypothetical protein KFK09_017720 [Dendrobium nobile]
MAASMASAASSFVLTASLTGTGTAAQSRHTSVSFLYNKPGSSSARRLSVRAEEASSSSPPAPAVEKETAVAAPAKPPPPPPIGPKRGTKDPKSRYPIVVRFNKVNYAGVSTNNYALDEIEEDYSAPYKAQVLAEQDYSAPYKAQVLTKQVLNIKKALITLESSCRTAVDSCQRTQKEELLSGAVQKPLSKSPIESSTSKSPSLLVNPVMTDAGDCLKNLNHIHMIQKPLFKHPGPLVIKEVSENSPIKILHVEGKGKAIDEALNSVTPNSFKSTYFPCDMNASTSGMKLFVNHFGNSNAIPELSHSKINENSRELVNNNFVSEPGSSKEMNVDNLPAELPKSLIGLGNVNPWSNKPYIKLDFKDEDVVFSEDGLAVKLHEDYEEL